MKYQPTTEYYRELMHECRAELKTLGYAKQTVNLSGVGEFLARMESQGKTRLNLVTSGDIKRHYAYLNERPSQRGGSLSQHTIPGYLFSLRLLFDYAERRGLVVASPLASLKFRQPKGGSKLVCSRAEIGQLYRACQDSRQRAILHLLYGCGLRRMEAAALNVGDLDHRMALLYVRQGKGKKRRVVPLGERVNRGLEGYVLNDRIRWQSKLSGNAFLLNEWGGRMLGKTINERLKELVMVAQINPRVSAHVLRHSIATHLLEQGMTVEKVRDFLGHELLETTQIYTHVKTEKL